MHSKEEWRLEKLEAEKWGYEIEKSDASEQNTINSSQSKYYEKNNVGLLYFAIDATTPQLVEMVYRGAKRDPSEIFKQGFVSQGSDPDLKLHAYPSEENRNFYKESGFVSTSKSKEAALKFPSSPPSKAIIQQTFLYEIIPSETGIDVVKEFPKLAIKPHEIQFYNNYLKQEKEIAFSHKIKPQDIKGAWPVDVYDAGIIQPESMSIGRNPVFSGGYYRELQTHPSAYIPNPNYKEPHIPNLYNANYNPKGAYILNAAKFLGHGLTGIGAALDAQIFYYQYKNSIQTRDFTTTYSEANRIVGGWAGASRLGLLSAQKALLYSASLTPLGQTVAVVISGVAGSVIGYYGGGETVQWLYNSNRRDDLIKPIYSDHIHTDKLSGTITTMKNGARVGKFTYNSTPAQDNTDTTNKPEAEARQKQHFSSLMMNIQAPTDTEPQDLYLSALNQQTQSINQLFTPSNVSIDSLQNHLNTLQSNAPSRSMSQVVTTTSRDLPEHLQNLTNIQNSFTQAFFSTRVTDFAQFTQQSSPTYYFETATEAARYATFYSNYLYGNFSERPKPASTPFSFFGGDNRGEGGRGWDRACDSRYQDCGSSEPGDCRSSNSDRCTSSFFK